MNEMCKIPFKNYCEYLVRHFNQNVIKYYLKMFKISLNSCFENSVDAL